jgi:hypothetical protein
MPDTVWCRRYPARPPRVTKCEALEALIWLATDVSALGLTDAQRRLTFLRSQLDSAPPHMARAIYEQARACVFEALREAPRALRQAPYALDPDGGFRSLETPHGSDPLSVSRVTGIPTKTARKRASREAREAAPPPRRQVPYHAANVPQLWVDVARAEMKRGNTAAALAPIFEALAQAGNSAAQIGRWLNDHGLLRERGGQWRPREVRALRAVLHRAAEASCSASTDTAQRDDLPASNAARHTNHNATQ